MRYRVIDRLLGRREVAILGAFRSGTNVTRALIELNYHATTYFHAFGWKHGPVPVIAPYSLTRLPRMPAVFVTKAPLSFLASLYDYSQRVGLNMEGGEGWHAFLREPFRVFHGRRGESPELRFANPIGYWNFVNSNYVSAIQLTPAIHLRYEDLLEAAEKTLEPAARAFALRRRRIGEFKVPAGRMGRQTDSPRRPWHFKEQEGSPNFPPFDRDAIVGRSYRGRFSEEDRAFVIAHVAADLCDRLGYIGPYLDKRPS